MNMDGIFDILRNTIFQDFLFKKTFTKLLKFFIKKSDFSNLF